MKNRSSPHRSRYAVTILLILISMFTVTSLYYNQTPYNPADLLPPLPKVNAVTPPSIILNPISGPRGVTVAVSGSGFSPSDTQVTLSSTPAGLGATGSCTVSSGSITGVCSFLVLNTAALGSYSVIATGNVALDPASYTFTVTNTATISINPISGPRGVTVVVSGSGFSPSDTQVALSSNPALLGAGGPCTVTGGSITGSCTFTVSNTAALGSYAVIATGNAASDFASYAFTVTATSPIILLNPISGPRGVTVVVSGSGFGPSDTQVALSSNPALLGAGGPCTVSSGSITGSCTFTVSNTAALGSYSIIATGNAASDFASYAFTVTATSPIILLNPISGPRGVTVVVSGSGFGPSDTQVALSSNPALLGAGGPCTVSSGSITGSCTFTVSNTAALGSYSIIATGNAASDFASYTFQVTNTATILLNPISGPRGVTVVVSGSGFSPSDAHVALSSTPAGLGATGSCTVSSGSITGVCSFTVLNTAALGSYSVIATGDVVFDSASYAFTVTNTATISINPISGPDGVIVFVSGSGFSPSDASVTLSSNPAGLGAGGPCTVTGGSITGSCTFTVSNTAALGSYSIIATGNAASDFASYAFTVANTATISINPISGPRGVNVFVSGSGFSPSDASVTLSSNPGGLGATGSCTVTGGSIAGVCSFLVSNTAALGSYSVIATGNAALDSASYTFQVTNTATISINPISGPGGVNVFVSGSGFSPSDASVALSSNPGGLGATGSCTVTGGSIAGVCSFLVSNTVALGSYAVIATGNVVSDFASFTFTVANTAHILVEDPISGPDGVIVFVSGSGFSPSDASVALSSNPGLLRCRWAVYCCGWFDYWFLHVHGE